MSQYLITVWHAPGVHAAGAAYASDADMEAAFARLDAFNTSLQSSGAFVAAGGLTPPEEALTVDATAASGREESLAQARVVEGPLAQADQHLGGFWIVEAGHDDAARRLAAEASYACGQSVELRRLQG